MRVAPVPRSTEIKPLFWRFVSTTLHSYKYMRMGGFCLGWDFAFWAKILRAPWLRPPYLIYFATVTRGGGLNGPHFGEWGASVMVNTVYISSCIHIHAHTCTYMHIHAHTCTCMHMHAYRCIQMHTHSSTERWEGREKVHSRQCCYVLSDSTISTVMHRFSSEHRS